MRAAHRLHATGGSSARGSRTLLACGLLLALLPAWAAPPATRRLGIKARTVRPRYAYALGGRALRVQRDCIHHFATLRVDVQVLNHGTARIDVPVRLRVAWAGPGQPPVYADVPPVAAGHAVWVRVDLPYAPRPGAPASGLHVSLTAAGQDWNRLRLPAPTVAAACTHVRSPSVAHARENRR